MNKKKGKNGTKVRQVKPTGKRLEGFMGLVNPTLPIGETQGDRPAPHISSEPAEESEHHMSSLVVGFAVRMRKRVASAQGEIAPVLKY